jgi:hypothetical protein
MKMVTRRVLIVIVALIPLFFSCSPKGTNVNQKKIDRERVQKDKEAQRQFDQAIKRHEQIQTKVTRDRMKQSKKEAKKLTPIER